MLKAFFRLFCLAIDVARLLMKRPPARPAPKKPDHREIDELIRQIDQICDNQHRRPNHEGRTCPSDATTLVFGMHPGQIFSIATPHRQKDSKPN